MSFGAWSPINYATSGKCRIQHYAHFVVKLPLLQLIISIESDGKQV
jgi:hypothetical protein